MNKLHNRIFTIDGVLSTKECDSLISRGNESGWNQSAPSGGGHGRTGKEDPRTNKFCVISDEDFTSKLFDRIKEHLPKDPSFLEGNPYFHGTTKGTEWTLSGLCERLRLYKYEEGDAFPEHLDYKMERSVVKDDLKKYRQHSFLTLLIYLNDNFEGGETGYWPDHTGIHCRFLRDMEKKMSKKDHQILITPKTGMVVLQDQDILHEGLPPTKKTKFILRTDVMYEKLAVQADDYKKPFVGDWERVFETSCKNYAD